MSTIVCNLAPSIVDLDTSWNSSTTIDDHRRPSAHRHPHRSGHSDKSRKSKETTETRVPSSTHHLNISSRQSINFFLLHLHRRKRQLSPVRASNMSKPPSKPRASEPARIPSNTGSKPAASRKVSGPASAGKAPELDQLYVPQTSTKNRFYVSSATHLVDGSCKERCSKMVAKQSGRERS